MIDTMTLLLEIATVETFIMFVGLAICQWILNHEDRKLRRSLRAWGRSQ